MMVMECNNCCEVKKYYFQAFMMKQKELRREFAKKKNEGKEKKFPCVFGCTGNGVYMVFKGSVWE